MRARVWAGFLAVCLLFTGCVRQAESEQLKSPGRFYYKTLDADYGKSQYAVDFELRETAGHETDLPWLLSEYFAGPQSNDLVAPFQRSTSLVSVEHKGAQITVRVSRDLAQLSGVDLYLACCCITLTCLELAGVDTVCIQADGALLDGKDQILLQRENLLLEDIDAERTSAVFALYFSDTENRYLIGEEIKIGKEEQANLPRYLLQRLMEGPSESGLAETIPLGTRILDLQISDGICNVDFSSEFISNAPRTELAQRMTILSLANTLCQLDNVKSVVLYSEGKLLSRYGKMDLSQPLLFEEGAVGPVRTGLNEFDADIFVTIGDSGLLSRLPVRIRQTANDAKVELVVQALLSFPEKNGYQNPVPVGTSLRSISWTDNRCCVDLTKEFLSMQESSELSLAVRAIAATIWNIVRVDEIQILVEGEVPQGRDSNLFQLKTPEDAWYTQGFNQ